MKRLEPWAGDPWAKFVEIRVDGRRTQVHLYFDDIEEDERFLFADIEFDDEGQPANACFRVDIEQGTNREFGRRYDRHCTALKLWERFATKARARLEQDVIELRRTCSHLPKEANDTQALASEWRSRTHDMQGLLGANNWEIALWFAEAESPRFLELFVGHGTVRLGGAARLGLAYRRDEGATSSCAAANALLPLVILASKHWSDRLAAACGVQLT